MTTGEKKLSESLKRVRSDRPIRLRNVHCAYCNIPLSDENETREHVVGRRFVPKGKLESQWNLIVAACEACNSRKSDLEDDISAITMLPDLAGSFGHDDEAAIRDAQNKAKKSYSRRTKQAVAQSQENIKIEAPFAEGVKFTFSMTGPAQVDEDRVYELARLQLTAFFYWITYNEVTRRGGFWPGGFYPLMVVRRSDWGNEVIKAFADTVVDWEPRVFGCNADGFFKVAVRRHPDAECWSWALEWNHSTRVVGFLGDRAAAEKIVAPFPKLEMQTLEEGNIIHRVPGRRDMIPVRIRDMADFVHPRSSAWKAIALLRAYFDESGTHGGSAVTAIGGLVATADAWSEVEDKWADMLADFRDRGVKTFHMTDFLAQEGEFERMDGWRREYMLNSIARILREAKVEALYSAVVRDDWEDVAREPNFLKRYPNEFFLCFEDVTRQLWEWAARNTRGEPVAPMFAHQPEYHGRMQMVGEFLAVTDWYPRFLTTISFGHPQQIMPLQAADFAAHSLREDIVHRAYHDGRGMRREGFDAAVAGHAAHGHWFDADGLRLTMKRFRETGEIYPLEG